MGKQDIAQKNYLANNARFADLFNGTLYHGRQVIDASDLNDANPVLSMVEGNCIIEKICDQMQKNKFCIWVLENQTTINYAMPIHVMLKEAMEYDSQRRKIADANRERWKREGQPENAGEYLYGFQKEDKLIPVNSLVLYWGEEKWDGATSLHELLKCDRENEHSEEILKHVPDYQIHVFNLNEPHDYGIFQTELREVFELYQRRNDRNEFMHYYASIDKQKMTFETVRFLGVITGSKRLVNLVEKKKEEEHKEDNDVCLAIEEMCTQQYEKGCSEGITLGRSEGIELGRSEGMELGRSEGIELGRSEGMELGRSEGIELGRGVGEGNFAKLILCLTRDHRNEDIEKVAMDETYRHKLFHEFGIEG